MRPDYTHTHTFCACTSAGSWWTSSTGLPRNAWSLGTGCLDTMLGSFSRASRSLAAVVSAVRSLRAASAARRDWSRRWAGVRTSADACAATSAACAAPKLPTSPMAAVALWHSSEAIRSMLASTLPVWNPFAWMNYTTGKSWIHVNIASTICRHMCSALTKFDSGTRWHGL